MSTATLAGIFLIAVPVAFNVTPARKEAVEVVFQSFNRYLGAGVGEHLGYGSWPPAWP
jgi:hypothetical protein